MLEKLILENLGPAPRLAMDPLAPRLNLITGDNGLGKTFLLDAAWWAYTGAWAGQRIVPPQDVPGIPLIRGSVTGPDGGSHAFSFPYNYQAAGFANRFERNLPAVYVRLNGEFEISDPVRSTTLSRDGMSFSTLGLFGFSSEEVLHGFSQEGRVVCNGLIRDWVGWQLSGDPAFTALVSALEVLSPPDEHLAPGQPTRVFVDDARDFPTLKLPYGDIPIIHASAAYRRITSLAYLLVWMWREHLLASKIKKVLPTTTVLFLVDEVDAHLHPRWQRTVLSSLLRVMSVLSEDKGFNVQLIATTHAPLVLASLDVVFDAEKDFLWDLDLVDGSVRIRQEEWRPRGDVNRWLTSPFFDLKEPKSKEAEDALQAAHELMRSPNPDSAEILRVQEDLEKAIKSDTDVFWVRWDAFRDKWMKRP